MTSNCPEYQCCNLIAPNEELNKDSPDEKNKKRIFYTWQPSSGELQVSAMFGKYFKATPKNIVELQSLIWQDDLKNLETKIKENDGPHNIVMPLRMRAAGQDYIWFSSCFVPMGHDLIIGMLEPMGYDDQELKQKAVCLAHERKSVALDIAKAGIWDWDIVTGKVYYDSNYLAMLGCPSGTFEQVVASWTERIHPDDYDETVKGQYEYVESPKHGDHFSYKFRFRTVDDSYIWVLGQGKVVTRDEQGKALRIIGLHLDITEEEEAKGQLEFMANHDALTGLHNRNHFENYFLQNDLDVLPAAYILVDADGLKMINDCVNHSTGDLMLQKLAFALRFSIRSSDLLARIGGDEFAIFLPRIKEENAHIVTEKIAAAIEATNEQSKGVITCASIGLSCATTLEELATLALRADMAMMEQKNKQKHTSLDRTKKWLESLSENKFSGYKDKRVKCE